MTNEWIMSEGGPLIIMDISLKDEWGGIFRLSLDVPDAKHDYDRACRLSGYIEKISIPGGNALLLGDVPMDSCFWKSASSQLYILSVLFCPTNFDADIAMRAFDPYQRSCDVLRKLNFYLSSSSIIMFDSADAGDKPTKSVSVDNEAGFYTITTYAHHPDRQTSLLIHCFDRKI